MYKLFDWRSGKSSPFDTRRRMRDGHVVTKSDRWVSSGYSRFLLHEDHPNAYIGANEHDLYNLYNLFHSRCKINKVKT